VAEVTAVFMEISQSLIEKTNLEFGPTFRSPLPIVWHSGTWSTDRGSESATRVDIEIPEFAFANPLI
jgi:hypothetical protein